jgi:hypothetical protein
MKFLAILPTLAFLAACGGQPSQSVFADGRIVPSSEAVPSKISPGVKRCSGTNGVSVSPCPLIITTSNHGYAQFNVSGTGVVTSYLKGYEQTGLCYNDKREEICSVQNLGSPPTYWQAAHGPTCGKAKPLKFYAYGVTGFVGYGYLEVINQDCP